MLRRAGRLWRTNLMILLADWAWLHGESAAYGWDYMLREPRRVVPEAVAMLYQSVFMDALSVFI